METILCKVTKKFDGHFVDELKEFPTREVPRLEKKGRVKRIVHHVVDRRSVATFPPNPNDETPGQAPPSGKIQFVDNRGSRKKKGPTLTYRPKKQEGPDETRPDGPDEDNSERTPAAKPVGPDLTRPIRPDSSKVVEAVQRNAFWWNVLVDGKPIEDKKGKPQNYRKSAAEETVKLLLDDAEVDL